MLSKIAIFSEPAAPKAQYFINMLYTCATSLRTDTAHIEAKVAGNDKNKREPFPDSLLSRHDLRLIHIVVIIAHRAGIVLNLVGTLYFVVIVIVVLGGIGCRIVDLHIDLD